MQFPKQYFSVSLGNNVGARCLSWDVTGKIAFDRVLTRFTIVEKRKDFAHQMHKRNSTASERFHGMQAVCKRCRMNWGGLSKE